MSIGNAIFGGAVVLAIAWIVVTYPWLLALFLLLLFLAIIS